ncbi:MAG: site-2 protease family protein [Ruminococcus sp.]|uniref:site-2 protease family protein n=1 Tax=Ruminococcus sp. TaxID=41978 RepID=UPI0025E13051|nr:site-2 protease family protein [Ruminococcus sp.]MCR5600694.1 site-2 protease family protein [Ruminococcus sp.]
MLSSGISSEFILILVARVATFMLVVPIHESAHGLMAKWLGDDTAKREGRITLNPFAHLDPFGMVIMLVVGFGWAKPVPVNISNVKHRRLGYFLISLAGPLSNIIAAFIGAGIYVLTVYAGLAHFDDAAANENAMTVISAVMLFLRYFVTINVGLAVFNLVPLPPLDGFNLLRSFMPASFDRWVWQNYKYIAGAFVVFVLLCSRISEISSKFTYVISIVENWIWFALLKITALFV